MGIPCVGAIVRDSGDRLLIVRRGRPPNTGLWSVPGGRVEPGETDEQAVVREVHEETGLEVAVVRLAGTVDRAGPDGDTYEIRDYLCRPLGGTLAAGDDASEVRWVTLDELGSLPATPGLLEAFAEWGIR